MSGFLYNGYCYSTMADLTSSFISNDGVNFYTVNSITSNTVVFNAFYKSFADQFATVSAGTLTRTFPTCPTVGPFTPSNLTQLFETYFAFDPAFFEQIQGELLIAFAVGLSAGAIVKLLQKT